MFLKYINAKIDKELCILCYFMILYRKCEILKHKEFFSKIAIFP